ncbi:MAG: hypothetical protein ABGX04_09405 [Myxococcales bacterium]|nr:hypothetical protein [Myxococcales bacterium]HIK84486.1 hypothetical protein [Myxococcales bacterium]
MKIGNGVWKLDGTSQLAHVLEQLVAERILINVKSAAVVAQYDSNRYEPMRPNKDHLTGAVLWVSVARDISKAGATRAEGDA